MRLIHYSKTHLEAVYSVPQAESSEGRLFKPRGLWVSIPGDDDWPSWCRSGEFGLANLVCETEVVLAGSAKILTLTCAAEIDDFHDSYIGDPLYPGSSIRYPDWRKVAEQYDGIVIAPYVYRRRLDGDASSWYYPWDCASGCIWRENAVADLRRLEPAEAQQ